MYLVFSLGSTLLHSETDGQVKITFHRPALDIGWYPTGHDRYDTCSFFVTFWTISKSFKNRNMLYRPVFSNYKFLEYQSFANTVRIWWKYLVLFNKNH